VAEMAVSTATVASNSFIIRTPKKRKRNKEGVWGLSLNSDTAHTRCERFHPVEKMRGITLYILNNFIVRKQDSRGKRIEQ
jgi:hypothetical protein